MATFPEGVAIHTKPRWVTQGVTINETTGAVSGTILANDVAGSYFKGLFLKTVILTFDSNGEIGRATVGGITAPDRNTDIYGSYHLSGTVPLTNGTRTATSARLFTYCDFGNTAPLYPCEQANGEIWTDAAWKDGESERGHDTKISVSLNVVPPEPDPEPIQCYLRNLNPYDNDQHISASPTSIKVQAYVSSSTPSRNRPNYYWIWETGEEPQVNHDIYQGTWRYAEITYTGLQPGSTHEMHAVAVNDAGAGGQADLTIRTRKEAPTITASIVSTTLETVTFRWSSDRYLARCYAMVGSDTIELGSNVASGTATSKWHEPNTTVSITIHGYVEAGDQETHGSKTISGKTLDIARFTSASGVFGNALRVNFTRASTAYGVMLTMFAKNTSNTTSVTITNGSASSQIRANYADTTFTQAQLDSIYKTYLNNVNTTTMYITISTFGDSTRPGGPKKYNDTQRTYTLTLTGIAKTMWFGVNDDQVPHRCQAWYGDANGTARRGVGFWGDTSGVGRRTI